MLPRFSIQQLFWVIASVALLALCMSSAARGNRVAFAVSVAVLGSFIPLLMYALVHWAAFLFACFQLQLSRAPVHQQTKQSRTIGVHNSEEARKAESLGTDSGAGTENG